MLRLAVVLRICFGSVLWWLGLLQCWLVWRDVVIVYGVVCSCVCWVLLICFVVIWCLCWFVCGLFGSLGCCGGFSLLRGCCDCL